MTTGAGAGAEVGLRPRNAREVPVPPIPRPRAPRPPVGHAPGGHWWAAGAIGARRHHADAVAGFRGRDGRLAVVVADGVGDSTTAAVAARAAAGHAARVAVLDGRADLGVLAARDLLLAAGGYVPGDAALVVALGPRPGPDRRWTVAWVGDCRAHSVDVRPSRTTVHPLTVDRTVGSELREAGVVPAGRLDHMLTTSVRTVRGAAEIGLTAVTDPAAIVLTTDGVHRAIDPARFTTLAAHVPAPALARTLVDSATAAGTRDNGTALVVATRA